MSVNGQSTGIACWTIGQEGPQPAKLRITGKDNSGNSRQKFADKLAEYSEKEFLWECEQYIWLSAFAANNPRSDWHWMCDLCYDESIRRGAPDLYERAWHRASGM